MARLILKLLKQKLMKILTLSLSAANIPHGWEQILGLMSDFENIFPVLGLRARMKKKHEAKFRSLLGYVICKLQNLILAVDSVDTVTN